MKKIKQSWDNFKQKIKNRLGEKKTAALRKALKVGRIIKNTICWILIAVLTIAIIIFMVTKISGGTPSVFGYSLHRIITGSMEPELVIGDVIVNEDISDPSEVAVGDIITFQGDSRFENQKVTHRVLVAPYDNGKGSIVLVTKGDANAEDDGEIKYSDVESKCIKKVSFFKDVYDFFFSKWGLIIFIGLLLLIFFDEITNIIRLTIGHVEKNDTESFQEIVERVKREQLEEMRKKEEAEKAQKRLNEGSKATDEQDDADAGSVTADSDVLPQDDSEPDPVSPETSPQDDSEAVPVSTANSQSDQYRFDLFEESKESEANRAPEKKSAGKSSSKKESKSKKHSKSSKSKSKKHK